MADSKLLMAIMRGQHDSSLADIADAIAERYEALEDQRKTAGLLRVLLNASGMSPEDAIAKFEADDAVVP